MVLGIPSSSLLVFNEARVIHAMVSNIKDKVRGSPVQLKGVRILDLGCLVMLV